MTGKIVRKALASPIEKSATPDAPFTIVGIGASAGGLEATLREALALLQGRVEEQSTQLEGARSLEGILWQTQAVLEQRVAQLTTEGRKGGNPLPPAAK